MEQKCRHYRQVTDAFGMGSPDQNLAFPNANLTAAEIIAYCPHWLKSVDVVDRFISNGGKSITIAALVNEFRDQPGGNVFQPNSVCTMIQNAMRRAGFNNWSVRKHFEWSRAGEWNEMRLDVSAFRTPRITHPKGNIYKTKNRKVKAIEFRDLALYVKKHPSGCDALDLTRCVLHAIQHPQETWLFPDHFENLVNKLGGPQKVTPLHCDRQVFFRRSLSSRVPAPYKAFLTTFPANVASAPNDRIMARTRSMLKINSGKTTPLKRGSPEEDTVAILQIGLQRRSGRLATKAAVNLCDDDSEYDITDKEGRNKHGKPVITKKRKLDDDLDIDGDFFQPDNATSSDESIPDHISEDEDFSPPPVRVGPLTPARKGRVAAKKALQTIKAIAAANKYKHKALTVRAPEILVDPALMKAARDFPQHKPVFLKPPILNRDRLVVDGLSVHLYAAPGARDLWESALSSSRFNGPRRQAPFRELYRLTDPSPVDDSDWAENIRWAKEQEKVFGSRTWTEYDYHLERITEHRRETMWVSEEAIWYGH